MFGVAIIGLLAAQGVIYTTPGFRDFSPKQDFRSVGVFGNFGIGDKLQKRNDAGLSTMTLENDVPANSLVWSSLKDGKDLVLGKAEVPGTQLDKRFTVVDWATIRFDYTTNAHGQNYANHVYGSRAFPAVLYSTGSPKWSWNRADLPFSHAAYRDRCGKIESIRANDPVHDLGGPWVVVWNDPADGGEVAPFLIRFEHKPKQIAFDGDLKAEFDHAAGSIAVMPLYGIRRIPTSQTKDWKQGLPPNSVKQIEFWTAAVAAFPIKVVESFDPSQSKPEVTVKNRFEYLTMADDWGTKLLRLAPVPPITAIAEANGYPVRWQSKIERNEVATFLGPFAYCIGESSGYTIPIPSARDNTLSPLQVAGDPAKGAVASDLNRYLDQFAVKSNDPTDGGLNLQLKELSEAYPLATSATRSELLPKMTRAIDASYDAANLSAIIEPSTGLRYLMCNKIWCADQPYDREWYTGRQLDFTSEYASYVDSGVAAKYWPEIQGLYAYFRIYSDWAWSGTSSSVFGYALTGDGMNFAMEGMLGTARMARRLGDQEVWRDASYRAAKEAVCTFAGFQMAEYAKNVDFATWTDTSYDYLTKKGRYESRRMDPAQVKSGFGIDIYTDKTGIKLLRPGMFWHAMAAIYWNNSSLDRLYDEHLYSPVYQWLYKTMPEQHPDWSDKDAMEKFDNTPYGSNLSLAVLSARAVICGESQDSLTKLSSNLLTNIAPLYTLRHKEDLVEADVPQIWLPMASASYQSAVWDAAARRLEVVVRGIVDGEAGFDWTWRGVDGINGTATPGPKPKKVAVNGQNLNPKSILGGYWRAPVRLKKGELATLIVSY